jgi:DNA-binding NtrC family response regulator
VLAKILFVDDRWQEEGWEESLGGRLPETIKLIFEHRGDKALQQLKTHPNIKLVLLDLHFEGQPKQGVEILQEIKKYYPELPVIILTTFNDVALALQLVHTEKTAYNYVVKGEIDVDQFAVNIENTVDHYELKADAIRQPGPGSDYIVGESAAMKAVLRQIEQVSRTDTSVLITGETGTGKELVARSIYWNSPRREKPYVVFNCANIPETLSESELFGHVGGAFTDAKRKREGRFEKANGGTIFFDEIGELKLGVQSNLLRVLQSREFENLGSSNTLKVNVRVISATNRDLEKCVAAGTFREDLYYRLPIPIHIPPLRDRKEDIPLLVKYIVDKFNIANRTSKEIDEEAMASLLDDHWPGNIRGLERVLHHVMTFTDSDVLRRADFSHLIAPGAEETGKTEDAVLSRWGKKVFAGEVRWQEIEREFAAAGEIRRKLLDWIISEWIIRNAERPSGNELATLLRVTRNYVNTIMRGVGLRLKDYGG